MKKYIKTICLLFAVLTLFSTSVLASDVKVSLDGEYLAFDVPPQIINGRTMVPLRTIFEALGAEVEWDGNARTVSASKSNKFIVCTEGSTTMYVNDEAFSMDVAPTIIDGRTLVPARFVAQALDCKVDWDGTTRTVKIIAGNKDYTHLPDQVIQDQEE